MTRKKRIELPQSRIVEIIQDFNSRVNDLESEFSKELDKEFGVCTFIVRSTGTSLSTNEELIKIV